MWNIEVKYEVKMAKKYFLKNIQHSLLSGNHKLKLSDFTSSQSELFILIKQVMANADEDLGKEETYSVLMKCYLVQPLQKLQWQLLRKLQIHLPQDLTVSVLVIYPEGITSYYRDVWSTMFIAFFFFIISRNLKWPRCLSTNEWI